MCIRDRMKGETLQRVVTHTQTSFGAAAHAKEPAEKLPLDAGGPGGYPIARRLRASSVRLARALYYRQAAFGAQQCGHKLRRSSPVFWGPQHRKSLWLIQSQGTPVPQRGWLKTEPMAKSKTPRYLTLLPRKEAAAQNLTL